QVGGRAVSGGYGTGRPKPCADTVAPRAFRPEIGPYRRPDFHADAVAPGVTAIPVLSDRGSAPLCRVALAAAAGVVSAPHADAPAPEAENPGSLADLAAGADGAAARPLCRGRPALDRPLDAGVPHPAGGPGTDDPALDPADMSARVSAAVG